MSKGDAPQAPNPYAVSAAQTQSNQQTAEEQAKLNAIDQTNPFGSTTFQRDANGDPTGQTSTLSPQLQQLLEGMEGLGGSLNGTASALAGNLPTGGINTNFGPTVQDTANAAFNQQKSMLQPGFDQQNTDLNTNLTNRGIPVGSEAWNSATKSVQSNQNNALTTAANAAQVAGANEQNTLFGQAVTQNQLPYQELAQVLGMDPTNSLIGAAPGAITPPGTSVSPTNVSGNVYQSYNDQLAQYNQEQQNLMGGLLGIAGIGLAPLSGGATGGLSNTLFGKALSDKNMKEDRKPTDREKILVNISKLPVDHYRYKDEAQEVFGVPEHRTGPMAQDWAKAFGGDGHTIDFADMAGHMLAAIQALETRTSHLTSKAARHG